ncbi:hypothetical protein RSOLAG1IB_10819 [Rhizoctonia solani AG-1 IB]|uniref:Nephrocystin 3-like N-terminal domain-containing protein n=1 Tax=Thanatephorus cucumeris (strain AG1-IB / isolate 7/3/14) TaxID=1108050 RepID=A0A0B7FZZ1_THACB|nr:hypothetical protein RSOLAG1IB_10819 [Rhizoctonia solani AG-1 IB]
MASNPSISLSPPQATLSPPATGRTTRPNSQVISPTQLSTARLAGNRSPNSMPSSPTSVHSSSSAIFERDIEQPSFVAHTIKDPHHISRAMTHELDAAVPSVLSAAISALNVGSEDDVSVIAPAQLNKPRLGHSRSPSPTARPPFVERQSTGPSPPATDTSPALSPHQTGASPTSPLSPVTPPLPIPRPRKSNPQLNTDTNRLSFMSYHDLNIETELKTMKYKQTLIPERWPTDALDRTDKTMESWYEVQSNLELLALDLRTNTLEANKELELTRMSPVMSAIYNSAEADGVKRGGCTPGTRESQVDLLLDWARTPDAGKTCWINRMAGTGKNTIAYTICSEFEKTCQLGASFFCSRTMPECRQVKNIIPSIAYQLASHFLFDTY